MSSFGDWEPDDSFDTEPPDPEQVARKLHELRAEIDIIAGRAIAKWDDLTDDEKLLAVYMVDRVLHWLRRQGGVR